MDFANFTEEYCTDNGSGLTLLGPLPKKLPFAASFEDGVVFPCVGESEDATIKFAGYGYLDNGNLIRTDKWNSINGVVNKSPTSNVALGSGVHVVICGEHTNSIQEQLFSVTQKPGEALPIRPNVNVVHWYSWDEPLFSSLNPYDQWFQIVEIQLPSAPAAPTGLAAVAGDGEITFTWNVSESTGINAATGQRLLINTVNDIETASQVGSDLSETIDSVTVTELPNDQIHYGWAIAFNDVGPSDPSNVASATPVAEPVQQVPAAPTEVSATAGDGTVAVSWAVSASTGLDAADGQRVYRNTVDNVETASQLGADLDAVTDSINDDTAENGTEYFYWPIAFNDAGESEAPDSASATPEAVVIPPSGLPAEISAIAWHSKFWAEDLTLDNEALVNSWPNTGSSTVAISQGTAGSQPQYLVTAAALNSKPAVYFDSTKMLQGAAFTAIDQPFHAVMIGNFVKNSQFARLATFDGGEGVRLIRADSGQTFGYELSATNPNNSMRNPINDNVAIITGYFEASSSEFDVNNETDNVGAVPGAYSSLYALSQLTVGDRPTRGRGATMHLAFFGIKTSAFTTQEIADLKAWAATYYGVGLVE